MQTVTTRFNEIAAGDLRPLSWALWAAFDKIFNDTVDFFEIGTSGVADGDMIGPDGSDIVQEWDKYTYSEYSDRVLGLEWTQEVEEPSGICSAIADITLKNEDKYFTPSAGSPIQDYILPGRPFRLYAGFSGENIPQFVGVNVKMPNIGPTASFHLVDFLSTLIDKDINQSVILENVSTDEALDYFFQLVGLSPTQYVLDHAFNLIDFVYFESGSNFGEFLRKLMEAEQGRLYMDELGIIRFKNRQNFSDTTVWNFNKSNVIRYTPSNQDKVINVVEITSNVRDVLANQKYWELSFDAAKNVVPPGGTVEIWAEFADPVTDIDDPKYITTATTSVFTTNTQEDGSGDTMDGSVVLTSNDHFATSCKMLFTNSSSVPIFVTTIELFATPAKVVNEIFTRQIDQVSIDKYGEQVLLIKNDYIPNETEAISKAVTLIEDYKEIGEVLELNVKGNPALQTGDAADIDLDGYVGTYVITKIVSTYAAAKFTQILTVRKKTIRTYFRIEESEIAGVDQIAY